MLILSIVLSELTVIRKMLYNEMKKDPTKPEMYNISPKLKGILKIVSAIMRSDICLISVERRTTAKYLFNFIKVFH